MNKAFGPKRSSGFRDNYLAPIMIAAAFLINSCATAQVDTNKVRQKINVYGYDYNNIKVIGSLIIPNDTPKLKVADSNAVAVIGNTQYKWSGYSWNVLASGVGGKDSIDPLSLKRNGKLFTKTPVAKSESELRSISNGDIDTGFIYHLRVGDQVGQFVVDLDDNSTPDDTVVNIRTGGGKLLKRVIDGVIYVDWWKRRSDPDDSKSFQRMFDWMADNGAYRITGKKHLYTVNTSINLPYYIPGQTTHKFIEIFGSNILIKTTAAISIFYRQSPPDDYTKGLSDYKLIFNGINFLGNLTTGQKAIEFGCTTGSMIVNNTFQNFDTAIVARFWLEGKINNNFFTNNKSVCILGSHYGNIYPELGIAGSAFNGNNIEGNRFYSAEGSFAPIMLLGQDQTRITGNNIFEGSKPRYQVYHDYEGNTGTTMLTFEDAWIESIGPPAVIFYNRMAGITNMKRIQIIYPDTLFHVPADSDPAGIFNIEDLPVTSYLAAVPFNGEGSNFSGRTFNFKNFGQSATNTVPANPAKWVGGVLPLCVNVEGTLGSNAGKIIMSSAEITIIPKSGEANPFARYLNFDSNLQWKTDNNSSIGGWYNGGDGRPRAGHFGTTGVYVDSASGFGFGRKGYHTIDLKLFRDSVGQLGVMNDARNAYKNIKAARGIFTARTGYDGVFSLTDLGDNDFITKQMFLNEGAGVNIGNSDLTLTGNRVFDGSDSTFEWRNFNTIYQLPKKLWIGGGELTKITGSIVYDQVPGDLTSGVDLYGGGFVVLPMLTEDQTINLENLYSKENGRTIVFYNFNSSDDHTWSFNEDVYDYDGNVVTLVPNLSTLTITRIKNQWIITSVTDSSPPGDGGGGGGDVTLNGAQTLTNKTLTSPKINLGGDQPGDLIKRNSSGGLSRFPVADSGKVVKSNGTDWVAGDDDLLEIAAGTGINVSAGTGRPGSPKVISVTGTAGSNPFKAISIEQYGGVADYSASGTTMTGTNNSTPLLNAINNASDGQIIVIGPGNWYFPTKITIPTTRRVKIICFGNVYAPNGMFNFTATGTRKHEIYFYGNCIGKLGLGTETKADFTNGTGMYAASGTNYNSLTATFIDVVDVTQVSGVVNKAEGYLAAIAVTTGTVTGGGVQEVVMQIGWFQKNKYGIWIRTSAGTGYGDKNVFTGINGGMGRIGGYQAVFLDGYSTEQAAMYNNKFINILFEACGYGFKATGNALATALIGCSWETGTNTGCWSGDYINIANAPTVGGGLSPVGTTFTGCSFLFLDFFTNCGTGTSIQGPLYVRNPSNFNQQAFVGSLAIPGTAGRLKVFASVPLNATQLSWLPSNIDLIPLYNTSGELFKPSDANYTITPNVKTVIGRPTATRTYTLPNAADFANREIDIVNASTNSSVITVSPAMRETNSSTIFNITAGQKYSIKSDGTDWWVIMKN
jgi:hypothetical protein